VGRLGDLEDEGAGSVSVGSLAVGFWKAIERKRTDSILAVGTNDKMCRLNCLTKDYRRERISSQKPQIGIVIPTHLGGHDLGGHISDEYCSRVPLIRGLVGRNVLFTLL
jgi:hypothetical protein